MTAPTQPHQHVPRIGIAGVAIEASVFSPHRTGRDGFGITRDEELLGRYGFLGAGSAWRERAEWVPLMHARALPGGMVLPETYDAFETEILDRIRDQVAASGPFDGFFLDIHGAMTVEGRWDAEARLATRIREAVGPETLISASMDLHGNVTRELAGAVDLITCYRMAPHEDAAQSRERAATNLVRRLERGGRPRKAWVQVPVLLPGEKTSTRIEPARSLYAQVPEVEARDGVLDAAIWVGYAWGDEPRCRAAVVVTGDDEAVIRAEAERLARSYWRAREEFAFVAPAGSLAGCLDEAVASDARPYFLSDSGDNPTAGGAGDVTWTLHRLLEAPQLADGQTRVIYASIPDAEGARAAAAAGVGATVDLEVGARVDAGPAGPVRLAGTVRAVVEGDPVAGTVVVVRTGTAGATEVILTERRKPYHREHDFTELGLDVRGADLVVVKIGYLEPELYAMAADWRLALTPGGVDQDLLRLGHQHVRRPLFPFDEGMADPDLTPELL